MAFTMSYGAAPPPTPAGAPPKAAAPKAAPRRSRKPDALRAEAQALFEPSSTEAVEAPDRSVAMDAPQDGAALPVLAEEEALASGSAPATT